MDAEVIASYGLDRAQQHLEHAALGEHYVDSEGAEKERIDSHAKEVPPPGRRGYPDVYVNGDVTVTVDPIKNDHWIRDDSYGHKHAASRHRGALKDHNSVMRAVGFIQACESTEGETPFWSGCRPPTTFVPTSGHLNESKKLSSKCVGNSTRGYGKRGEGELPTFSKLIWQNRLGDKPDWLVWRDMWTENTHGSRDRRFDCGGMCR